MLQKKTENNNLQANNLERNKRETISASDYLEFNNKSIKKIIENNINNENNIYFLNDNIYFFGKDGFFYVLKNGEATATKINGINDIINSHSFDNDRFFYISTSDGVYVLKNGEATATKINGINGIVTSCVNDSQDNLYFITNNEDAYVLKNGEATPVKIKGIENKVTSITKNTKNNINNIFGKNKIFFAGQKDIYVLKSGEITATKINILNWKKIIVDHNDNAYINTSDVLYIFKKNNEIIKIMILDEEINDIHYDNNDKIYIATNNKNVYVLKSGETTPTKIDGIDENITSITMDNNTIILTAQNNKYYINNNYKKAIKIIDKIIVKDKELIVGLYSFDNNQNIYVNTLDGFLYKLIDNQTPIKIKGISHDFAGLMFDNENNVYINSWSTKKPYFF